MQIDEGLLISCLDDTWRTVPGIKRLVGRNNWEGQDIYRVLRRLADAGRVGRQSKPLGIPVARNRPEMPKRCLDYFRRRP